jgi:hypothetical protein
MNSSKKVKRLNSATSTIVTKELPHYLGPTNLENTHLAWRFSSADLGGPYSCADLSHDKFKQLWDRLRAFETKNVSELRQTGSFHDIPVFRLEKDAQNRLNELKLDDLDEVFSFRMDGTCRLICMKYLNIFSILWWDDNHLVVFCK